MIFSLLASVMLVGCQKFEELERKNPENVLRGAEDDVTDIDEDDDDAGITDVDEDEDEEISNKGGDLGGKGSGGINDNDEDEDEAAARISQ